jgi:Bacterial SH3 domain
VAAVIGSALVALSSVAPWTGGPSLPLGLDQPRTGFDVPLLPLVELDPGPSILTIGLVIAALGVVGLLASLVPPLWWLRRALGIVVVALATLFVVQVVISTLSGGDPGDLLFRVGVGPYSAALGAILMVAGRSGRRPRPRAPRDEQPSRRSGPTLGFGGEETQSTPVAQAPKAGPPKPVEPVEPAPFAPSHRVPTAGLPSWTSPDPSAEVGPTLESGLPLQVVERRAAWALVRASNGWTGWVDARKLELS